jgi:hypothetical protein
VGLSGTATGCSLAALIPCGTRFHNVDATLYAYKTYYLLVSYNRPVRTPTSEGLRALQHRSYPVLHTPNPLPEIKGTQNLERRDIAMLAPWVVLCPWSRVILPNAWNFESTHYNASFQMPV